jgi:AbrB family looped-hinge helix DNA binding protein
MAQQTRTRISEKGRLVIPASLRAALGIKIGDEVNLRIEDNELRISTLKNRIERAQRRLQRFAKQGRLMSEELSAERREAAKHE